MPVQIYSDPASSTWTVPSGYRCVQINVSAPGGAGGPSNQKAAQVGSGGGGQGGAVEAITNIPQNTVINYIIGNRGDTETNPDGGGVSVSWLKDGSYISIGAIGGRGGEIGGGFPGNGGVAGSGTASPNNLPDLISRTLFTGANGADGHDVSGDGGDGGGISGGNGGAYDNNAGMSDGSDGCGGGGASGSMSYYAGGKGGNGSVQFTYEIYTPPTFSGKSGKSMLVGSWI